MSCDVYFYNLGRRLGIDRISEIATSFGFGQPTGVDLSFEKSGLVPSEEWATNRRGARWYPSETISVAIGQGPLLVTSMQVARALVGHRRGRAAADAAPLLLLAGPAHGRAAALQGRVSRGDARSPKEKLDIVKNGMWAVVNEPGGTAYGSRVERRRDGRQDGHRAGRRAAKPRSGPAPTARRLQDHAWFAGFGPVDDPQMVVVVFVENGGHGNLAAAPLAKALFEARFGTAPDASGLVAARVCGIRRPRASRRPALRETP